MDERDYIEARCIPEPNSGCWLWEGPPGTHDYGQAKGTTAHRVAYRAFVGDIPKRHFVCHRCDNKLCVNPDHLYAGTHKQNMDDVARGGRHPNRKLTEAQVAEIKSSGEPQRVLAKRFGVNQKAIWQVRKGLARRHS